MTVKVNNLKLKMRQPMPKETILLGLALLIFVFSFTIGRYPISPGNLLMISAARFFPIPHTWPATMDVVLFSVRLPRIIAAMLVGAALATSGAAFQGMFRNPLVSPDILGASMGAGFGLIGWVGLIVPHWARMIVGPDYKVLLPTAIILGAAYLLMVDDLARCLFSVEIPLGILTAIIGAPFFYYLLVSGSKRWR